MVWAACARERQLAGRDKPPLRPECVREDEVARVAVEGVRGHGDTRPGKHSER